MQALLIILSHEGRESWVEEITKLLPGITPTVVIGSPLEAAQTLATQAVTPSHIVLDIGARGQDVLAEVDQLAQQCEAGTRVLAVGDTNDIVLYRGLLARGVVDYLPIGAASASEVVRILSAVPAAATPAPVAPTTATAKPASEKRVIVFMSAASGDGGSTAALNTAYALSQHYNGSTVLVAKNLNLQNQYGIADLFDHPERGLDATLIKRMVANYGKLDVITAPIELRYLPTVSAEAIRELIATLQHSYDNVVIDLPHVWLPWVAAVTQQATQVVLVAQLWLKSVSNAARMMRVFREMQVPLNRIIPVINRSGAKFKEAIDSKDFERVCGTAIRYTLANDIKTVVNAEAAAKTIMQMEPSDLASDIEKLTRGIMGQAAGGSSSPNKGRGGLFSLLKG